jgi:transposase
LGLDYLGVAVMPKKRRLDARAAEIKRMYDRGMNASQIATAMGEKLKVMYSWMNANNMPAIAKAHTAIMDENQAEIRKLRAQKVTFKVLAEKYGVTDRQLRAYCQHRNIVSYSKKHVPRGRLSFAAFTQQDCEALGEMAKEWGCADLSEAITEIVRDAIAEHQAKSKRRKVA